MFSEYYASYIDFIEIYATDALYLLD
jgi:hypothetical protein